MVKKKLNYLNIGGNNVHIHSVKHSLRSVIAVWGCTSADMEANKEDREGAEGQKVGMEPFP